MTIRLDKTSPSDPQSHNKDGTLTKHALSLGCTEIYTSACSSISIYLRKDKLKNNYIVRQVGLEYTCNSYKTVTEARKAVREIIRKFNHK